jgi:hypothetical protein
MFVGTKLCPFGGDFEPGHDFLDIEIAVIDGRFIGLLNLGCRDRCGGLIGGLIYGLIYGLIDGLIDGQRYFLTARHRYRIENELREFRSPFGFLKQLFREQEFFTDLPETPRGLRFLCGCRRGPCSRAGAGAGALTAAASSSAGASST